MSTVKFSAAVMTFVAACTLLVLSLSAADEKPTPADKPAAAKAADGPDFGPNVLILDPATEKIQDQVNAIFGKQEHSEFGTNRYAILFKPGKYNLDVHVGYYTQLLGLGKSPDDVTINGAVRSTAALANGNATCNFWRSAENLAVAPKGANVWAVSQATALRRVHMKGKINLWDGGWSSGGFIADCKIDAHVVSGSQQQWLSRNAEWGGWDGGVWNMVFVGVTNPPGGTWPGKPVTVIDKTPVIREKPYLTCNAEGHYAVMVPDLQSDTKGTSWSKEATPGKALAIDEFHVARADKDTAATINAALEKGKNLLLTPGIYQLDSAIKVTKAGTVVLGLGYATLHPTKGTPAMEIADVDGVKVGGLIFEATETNSPTLLQVGEQGKSASHAKDPIFLYDICGRVGGPVAGQATCIVTIDSANVVGDNFWLWRADHGAGEAWDKNKNKNGLVVNGNDVTIYGLFVEHNQEYQTLWNGDGGRVYFYQSEMPYDVPSQDAWKHDSVNGYASYKVADKVKTHEAWGLGIYCFFRDADVVADNAIETPKGDGIKMHHMVTVFLTGKGGIKHVINGTGNAVMKGGGKATVD